MIVGLNGKFSYKTDLHTCSKLTISVATVLIQITATTNAKKANT